MSETAGTVRVGVKYCGGCNERFDRMGVYRRIMSQCSPETRFDTVAGREKEDYDFILVLCGCQAQCPDISKLHGIYGLFSLYQDSDPQQVVRAIREIEAEKKSQSK